MAEVEVHEGNVNLLMDDEEASLLMTLLLHVDVNNAGKLSYVIQELMDAGVEPYADLFVATTHPKISIHLQEQDNAVSPVSDY